MPIDSPIQTPAAPSQASQGEAVGGDKSDQPEAYHGIDQRDARVVQAAQRASGGGLEAVGDEERRAYEQQRGDDGDGGAPSGRPAEETEGNRVGRG